MLRGFTQTAGLRRFGFWIMGRGFTLIGARGAVGHIQHGVRGVRARMGHGLIPVDAERGEVLLAGIGTT